MQVNGGCLQIRMAEHHLDASQVGAGFEKVGGKAVAKRVGRHSLLYASSNGGFVHSLPDNLFSDRFVCARVIHRAGEQVGLGPHPAVVRAQRAKQLLTQGNFPIDAALALYHAQHHALAVNVGDLETAQLSAPQAGRVEGHQYGAVVEVARRADQQGDFIRAEDHRQPQALFWIRQILLHVSPLQHLDVEKAESANVQNNGVDGQFPGSEQVRVVTSKVIGTDLVDRRIDVASEMLYSFQVRVDGRSSVVAAHEFFSHPLYECHHRNLL